MAQQAGRSEQHQALMGGHQAGSLAGEQSCGAGACSCVGKRGSCFVPKGTTAAGSASRLWLAQPSLPPSQLLLAALSLLCTRPCRPGNPASSSATHRGLPPAHDAPPCTLQGGGGRERWFGSLVGATAGMSTRKVHPAWLCQCEHDASSWRQRGPQLPRPLPARPCVCALCTRPPVFGFGP